MIIKIPELARLQARYRRLVKQHLSAAQRVAAHVRQDKGEKFGPNPLKRHWGIVQVLASCPAEEGAHQAERLELDHPPTALGSCERVAAFRIGWA